MYRCEACGKVQPARKSLTTFAQMRDRRERNPYLSAGTEIAREIKCCNGCQAALADGITVEQIRRALQPRQPKRPEDIGPIAPAVEALI